MNEPGETIIELIVKNLPDGAVGTLKLSGPDWLIKRVIFQLDVRGSHCSIQHMRRYEPPADPNADTVIINPPTPEGDL